MYTEMTVDENTRLRHKQMKVYSVETNSMVKRRKWFVDLLTCMFGIGSWILVNSLYTQFPLLVKRAPEGWSLPSYLSISVQIGNLGPLLYSAWRKKYENKYDRPLTIFIMILGIISIFLMAKFYDVSTTIFGQPHSVILCILTFTISLVGCTSSVLFIPSLSHYPDVYLVTYMVGEGISGFVPSIIALFQGVGTTTCHTVIQNGQKITEKLETSAYFSSGLFFIIIGIIMCISTISYLCLQYTPVCKKEKNKLEPNSVDVHNNAAQINTTFKVVLLTILGILVFFANGLLPSIQSYSCLPYGYMAYHLTANLSNIANPIACFFAFYTNRTSKVVIYILCSICVVSILYMLMTAITSPSPPLQKTTTGIILIVFMWVLFYGCASYVKLSIAAVFRNGGNKGLFQYGCITQIGSLAGAIIGFYLIDIAQLFQSYEPC